MRKYKSFSGLLFLSFAGIASAAPIIYHVTVNASSISGTAGSLDFNFNPGPFASQAASAQVLNFASDGSLAGSPQTIGDVSNAPLPAPVTFDNGSGFNDYFEGFTFGSTLTFDVSLYGPALSFPNGTATSGSVFAFSMFSDSGGTVPVLTNNPSGFALLIDVNLDGTTTVMPFSAETNVQAVPEPGSFVLVAWAVICWGYLHSRQRSKLDKCRVFNRS